MKRTLLLLIMFAAIGCHQETAVERCHKHGGNLRKADHVCVLTNKIKGRYHE